MTSGASVVRAQELGGGEAVHPGHPDVHQHHVGPVLGHGRATSLPSAASPTISMSSAPREQHRRGRPGPARRRRRRSTRICSLTPATVARRGARKSPCSSSPCSRRPPASVARSARPTRPGARSRGSPARRRPGPAPGCAPRSSARRPGAPSTRSVDRRAGRVLARVGQRLLDDPQRVPPDRRRGRRPGRRRARRRAGASRPRVTPRAARAAPRASAAAAGGASLSAPSRRTPITARRSSSAWCALARITAGGARDLLRRRVGPELQCAGVQAEQRDAVGEDVVHLACDPRPLGVPGLLDAQLLLGLGVACKLAPRLAAAAEEHAPRDDCRQAQHPAEVVRRRTSRPAG